MHQTKVKVSVRCPKCKQTDLDAMTREETEEKRAMIVCNVCGYQWWSTHKDRRKVPWC